MTATDTARHGVARDDAGVSGALDPAQPGWHWPERDLRAYANAVADLVVDALVSGSRDPVTARPATDLLDAWSSQPWPSIGASPDELWHDIHSTITPHPFGNAHPRFSAWVNPPPHPLAAMVTAVAAAMNPSVAGGNHSAVHLEHQVVRWFTELIGWGQPGTSEGGTSPRKARGPTGNVSAGGQLVSGASAAALTALTVARHQACASAGFDDRRFGLAALAHRATVYGSSQAHSCHTKAVEALGIGSGNLVAVDTDCDDRMLPDDLNRKLAGDIANGALPIAVLVSTGTVNTGAVDPIDAIADVCAEHGVWLHVDGAYGGPAVLLLDEWSEAKAGMARADSISIDPHKWLYVPVDAGLVLFADNRIARDTFSLVPDYLRTDGDAEEPVWFSEYGLEQTRPFRALKVWVALKHLGREKLAELIARDIAVANALRAAADAADDFEVLGHGLSVVCFRHRPTAVEPDRLDEHNEAVVTAVRRRGNAFVAGTRVDGHFALRACVVNPTTTTADVTALLNEIRAVTQ